MPRTHDYRYLAEIGRRIRERREAKGWSQAQLGRRAWVRPQQISKYELGLSDPPVSTVLRICTALGMLASSLLVEAALLAEQDKTVDDPIRKELA